MNKIRKVLAGLLCICMVFANGVYTPMAAEAEYIEQSTTESDASGDSIGEADEEYATDSDADKTDDTTHLLNYLYMDSANISTPDSQKILAGIGDGSTQIDSAAIYYVNNTSGAEYQAQAVYTDNESALFELSFTDDSQTGSYMITAITYIAGGAEYRIDLADTGIDGAFGVNCEVETSPDVIIEEEPEDASLDGVIITDASGASLTAEEFEEAVVEASDGRMRAGNDGNIVVVLDAGHGNAGDTGAVYTWNGVTYVERDINLKIAQYCEAALKQYSGVTVYMTRTEQNNGLQLAPEAGESVGQLVKYAQSVDADILVSIHNNSAGAASANGSEVYYPNENYNASLSQQGKELSEIVLSKLQALGLASRGAKIRNNTAGERPYPDGSVSDYYGIVRQAKLCGFPGIIIEHAFLTNQSDAENFLGSEEALKRLGEADAEAIAEYFGLTNIEDEYQDGDAAIGVVQDNVAGQYTIIVSGVPNAYGVSLKVKNEKTGVTKEYGTIKGSGDGCWYSNFNIRDFNATGTYTITAYVNRRNGSSYRVGSTNIAVKSPSASVAAFDADGQKTFILTADNVSWPSEVKSIKFGVWNEGLSDLRWYSASKEASGRWLALMAISDYKKSGTYYVDAYATYSNGKEVKLGSTSFKVSNVSTNGIIVRNPNENAGTFDIVINGVYAASGVASVRVPVWTAHDLSDLYWYDAEKQSDGSYIVHVDIKNHKYNYGVYAMQSYVTSNNGIQRITYNYCYRFEEPTPQIYPFNADNESNYILVAEGIPGGSNVTGVRYGVWNEGLSDLRWYDAVKDELGRWLAVVGIQDYKKSGTYYADAYVTTSDGSTYKLGGTHFTVTAPYAEGLTISSLNETAGTYDVIIKGIVSPSGVASVRVPAWTALDLSDIHWYDAIKQSDGSYKVTINIANHKGHYGIYGIQAYVLANNGVESVAASTCYNFVQPTDSLYEISGSSNTSVAQMVAYYNAHATYPSFYETSDAPTIEDFCRIYLEECAAEGIKAEVAFCQAMKETGFLKYGGAVDISQYNFAGIGATDGGGVSATFSSVREGIRAQVQHLKAYASKEPLVNACVDPRFGLVTRGTAQYVEWLGIQENPYGKGWASAARYGYSLRLDYIEKLLKY